MTKKIRAYLSEICFVKAPRYINVQFQLPFIQKRPKVLYLTDLFQEKFTSFHIGTFTYKMIGSLVFFLKIINKWMFQETYDRLNQVELI